MGVTGEAGSIATTPERAKMSVVRQVRRSVPLDTSEPSPSEPTSPRRARAEGLPAGVVLSGVLLEGFSEYPPEAVQNADQQGRIDRLGYHQIEVGLSPFGDPEIAPGDADQQRFGTECSRKRWASSKPFISGIAKSV